LRRSMTNERVVRPVCSASSIEKIADRRRRGEKLLQSPDAVGGEDYEFGVFLKRVISPRMPSIFQAPKAFPASVFPTYRPSPK